MVNTTDPSPHVFHIIMSYTVDALLHSREYSTYSNTLYLTVCTSIEQTLFTPILSYTVNVDVFACIHFREFEKISNFAEIKICVFIIIMLYVSI